MNVFIASSKENKIIADIICSQIGDICSPEQWSSPDSFPLGKGGMEFLTKALDKNHIGIFVFGPDDTLIMRDKNFLVTRDNVVFELGLFVGRRGFESSVIFHHKQVKLPSDLNGITTIQYDLDSKESDETARRTLNSPLASLLSFISKAQDRRAKASNHFLALIKCKPGEHPTVIERINDSIPSDNADITKLDYGIITGQLDNFLLFRAESLEASTKYLTSLRHTCQSCIAAVDTRTIFPDNYWANPEVPEQPFPIRHLVFLKCHPSMIEQVYSYIVKLGETQTTEGFGHVSKVGILYGDFDIFFIFHSKDLEAYEDFVYRGLKKFAIIENCIESPTSRRIINYTSRVEELTLGEQDD